MNPSDHSAASSVSMGNEPNPSSTQAQAGGSTTRSGAYDPVRDVGVGSASGASR